MHPIYVAVWGVGLGLRGCMEHVSTFGLQRAFHGRAELEDDGSVRVLCDDKTACQRPVVQRVAARDLVPLLPASPTHLAVADPDAATKKRREGRWRDPPMVPPICHP
jgi:hypothetical protein